jgi:hypothetical protein
MLIFISILDSLKKNEKTRLIKEGETVNVFFQFKKITLVDLFNMQVKAT